MSGNKICISNILYYSKTCLLFHFLNPIPWKRPFNKLFKKKYFVILHYKTILLEWQGKNTVDGHHTLFINNICMLQRQCHEKSREFFHMRCCHNNLIRELRRDFWGMRTWPYQLKILYDLLLENQNQIWILKPCLEFLYKFEYYSQIRIWKPKYCRILTPIRIWKPK